MAESTNGHTMRNTRSGKHTANLNRVKKNDEKLLSVSQSVEMDSKRQGKETLEVGKQNDEPINNNEQAIPSSMEDENYVSIINHLDPNIESERKIKQCTEVNLGGKINKSSSNSNKFSSLDNVASAPILKSGPSNHKYWKKVHSVPYRKCQTHVEERVVAIINKLKNKRECRKEIINLSSKISKVSRKDLLNRYLVSGVRVILNELRKVSEPEDEAAKRLEESFCEFQDRIIENLENVDEFLMVKEVAGMDDEDQKRKLIKKVYKILRVKHEGEGIQQDLMKVSMKKVDEFMFEEKQDMLEFLQGISQQL